MTTPRVTVEEGILGLAHLRVDGKRHAPLIGVDEARRWAHELNTDPHALSAFLVAWPEKE